VNLKYIEVPFEGGHAKLAFHKQGANWVCVMPEQSMSDLQAYIKGEEPTQTVNWIDLNGLDNS
jgi:hypothetical protein